MLISQQSNKIVNSNYVRSFKAIAFKGSYLWKIENPILENQVQECIGEFEIWCSLKVQIQWRGFLCKLRSSEVGGCAHIPPA